MNGHRASGALALLACGLTVGLRAEQQGVDLSKPLGNQASEEIHRALAENLVIFFRDQHITEDQHLEFGRGFGKLHVHPAAPHAPGHPETIPRIIRIPTANARRLLVLPPLLRPPRL